MTLWSSCRERRKPRLPRETRMAAETTRTAAETTEDQKAPAAGEKFILLEKALGTLLVASRAGLISECFAAFPHFPLPFRFSSLSSLPLPDRFSVFRIVWYPAPG